MHIGGKISRETFIRNLEGLMGSTDGEASGDDFPKELLEVGGPSCPPSTAVRLFSQSGRCVFVPCF